MAAEDCTAKVTAAPRAAAGRRPRSVRPHAQPGSHGVLVGGGHAVVQVADEPEAQQDEAETEDGFAQCGPLAVLHQHEGRQHQGIDVVAEFKVELGGHEPGHERVAHGSAHQGGQGLHEGEHPRVDEADGHQRRGGGRKNHGRDQGAGEQRGEAVGGQRVENVAEAVACQLLQAFAHEFGAVHQQAEASQKF